jgi:hypothetical protein
LTVPNKKDNTMSSLGSHANVYNTCLRVLKIRGYTLWIEGFIDKNTGSADPFLWYAKKNGRVFYADNPIELLGLTTIDEHVGSVDDTQSYWWVVEGPDIWDELIENMIRLPDNDFADDD